MFKIICKENDCINKDIIYYDPYTTEVVICGGCKTNLKAIKMTKVEFEKIFDYDPYQKTEII